MLRISYLWACFFHDFSSYMKSVILSKKHLMIVGYLNIHLDVHDDSDAKKVLDQIAPLVSSNTWTSPSMYINIHSILILITHKTSNLIQNSPSASRYFSDHASVICDLTMKRPASQVMTVSCKKLRSIDMDGFHDNLGSSGLYRADFSQCHAPLDLDHLVDDYAPGPQDMKQNNLCLLGLQLTGLTESFL